MGSELKGDREDSKAVGSHLSFYTLAREVICCGHDGKHLDGFSEIKHTLAHKRASLLIRAYSVKVEIDIHTKVYANIHSGLFKFVKNSSVNKHLSAPERINSVI